MGHSSGTEASEEAVDVAHFHHHRLQLGEVLDGHLAVLSAEACGGEQNRV